MTYVLHRRTWWRGGLNRFESRFEATYVDGMVQLIHVKMRIIAGSLAFGDDVDRPVQLCGQPRANDSPRSTL